MQQLIGLFYLAAAAVALLSASAEGVDLKHRSHFAFVLKNPSAANLDTVKQLTQTLASSSGASSWAFGSDLNVEGQLGILTRNFDFGGYFEFDTLQDLQDYLRGEGNTQAYQNVRRLILSVRTVCLQTVHVPTVDYSSNITYYYGILGLFFPNYASPPGEYSVGKATSVLADITQRSPSYIFDASFETDGDMQDILSSSPWPYNYNFVATFTFLSFNDMTNFYTWFNQQPAKLNMDEEVAGVMQLQFTSLF